MKIKDSNRAIHLDTNAIIYLIGGRLMHDAKNKILDAQEIDQLSVSVIAIAEVKVGLDMFIDMPQSLRELIAKAKILNFTTELVDSSAKIRRLYNLSLTDAIIAATAISNNARLMTGDKVFERVKGLEVLKPDLITGS